MHAPTEQKPERHFLTVQYCVHNSVLVRVCDTDHKLNKDSVPKKESTSTRTARSVITKRHHATSWFHQPPSLLRLGLILVLGAQLLLLAWGRPGAVEGGGPRWCPVSGSRAAGPAALGPHTPRHHATVTHQAMPSTTSQPAPLRCSPVPAWLWCSSPRDQEGPCAAGSGRRWGW